MRIIETGKADFRSFNEHEKLWVYNGLDCCVTYEVLTEIKPQLDDITTQIYKTSKSLMAPVLEMNMRGIKVDLIERDKTIASYEKQIEQIERQLRKIIYEIFGIFINWRSNDALKDILYTRMKIPPIKKRNDKGEYVSTVNRDALERLNAYFYARPIISHILAMRDIGKKIGVLKTAIDLDGRMRTSYNIAGTTTYRFSSSLSDFGTGTNLQNIEQKLRRPFIADDEKKLCYIDLEQAESRAVGAFCWNIFQDSKYLDACESGDLHTSVCRMAWPGLPWTGDLRRDRAIAELPFYRQHSYRHMAKVLGHGTNYRGQPYTMSQHTKLDQSIIREFQERYFTAFPAIKLWHKWVANELVTNGFLYTLTGHRRYFFGRRDDDSTIREAIAFGPQGSVGVLLNLGMLNVWRLHKVELLLQIHDAIVFQFPEQLETEIVPLCDKAIKVPVELYGGRKLIIPSEAKTGWNWADQIMDSNGNVIDNFDGLKKYKGNDDRVRGAKTR
jgi:DNA polymerase-1